MKKVIFIEQPKEETKKPVEFTHNLSPATGWTGTGVGPSDCSDIVYLGKCAVDGDMFMARLGKSKPGTNIHIFKGHLNSGEY